jgi:hypothetical protein
LLSHMCVSCCLWINIDFSLIGNIGPYSAGTVWSSLF